jgi:hypothetical protein
MPPELSVLFQSYRTNQTSAALSNRDAPDCEGTAEMVDAETVRAGYTFSTPALDLGALVVDGGAADPTVPIRIPITLLIGTI